MKNPNTLAHQPRTYLPDDYKVTVWSKLRPYFNELLQRNIQSKQDLEKWLADKNELTGIIQEEFKLRCAHKHQDSEDEAAAELYEYALQKLSPKIAPIQIQLNKKLLNCKHRFKS